MLSSKRAATSSSWMDKPALRALTRRTAIKLPSRRDQVLRRDRSDLQAWRLNMTALSLLPTELRALNESTHPTARFLSYHPETTSASQSASHSRRTVISLPAMHRFSEADRARSS